MVTRDDFTDCETHARLDGKVAVVTGATSGMGLEIAKDLARRGAKVIIASRNAKKLEGAKDAIIKSSGHKNVITKQMDFESLKTVRNFAREIAAESRLDILVNNVGAIGLPDRLTEDNLHVMMQVNYFGMFLLTFLLFPLLKSSAPSRIVNVSSVTQIFGYIDFDNMNKVGKYSSVGYYSNAKLAEVLFTVEMAKRIQGSGVNVYSMDPGLIKSDFFRNFNNSLGVLFSNALLLLGRPPHRVARMAVYLAVDPKLQNSSGKHFRDCAEFYSNLFANDAAYTRRLWVESKRLVGITTEEDWEISNNVSRDIA